MRESLNSPWNAIRHRMMAVARPDSRFDMDLDRFIPAFEGVDEATRRLVGCDDYATATTLFVTPDNSMQRLRHLALAARKTLVVPTYGLRRGFLRIDPGKVEPSLALYASWGDGVEHFGVPVPIEDIASLGAIDLVVAGAAAVTAGGLRFGMGHRYLDVEWNIFRTAGLVGDRTPVWTIVHDHQVLDATAAGDADEILVDRIFTPTRVIETPRASRPSRIRPETLAALFEGAPPAALSRAVRLAGSDVA